MTEAPIWKLFRSFNAFGPRLQKFHVDAVAERDPNFELELGGRNGCGLGVGNGFGSRALGCLRDCFCFRFSNCEPNTTVSIDPTLFRKPEELNTNGLIRA